jgi:NAD-dependent dihydropyrimidine dehydrogenase PreA subunit
MGRYNVITDRCVRDLRCVSACLRNAIHPTRSEPGFSESKQLFIHPGRCISCGSCLLACDHDAIVEVGELPDNQRHVADLNAAYFAY